MYVRMYELIYSLFCHKYRSYNNDVRYNKLSCRMVAPCHLKIVLSQF